MTHCKREPLAVIEFISESKDFIIYCLFSRAFIRTKLENERDEVIMNGLIEHKINDKPMPEVSYSEDKDAEYIGCNKQEVETLSGCCCCASNYSTDGYNPIDQSLNKDKISVHHIHPSDNEAHLNEHFADKQFHIKSCHTEVSCHHQGSALGSAWESYWSKNGENIIWKSWIEKYGAYINPNFLEQNYYSHKLNVHENLFGNRDVENIKKFEENIEGSSASSLINNENVTPRKQNFIRTLDEIPGLKISRFSSCSNLLETSEATKKNTGNYESDGEGNILKSNSFGSYASYERVKYVVSDDDKLKSESERVRSRSSNASPSMKSIANTTVTTDSMTNVTKITLSSLDLSCDYDSTKSGSLSSSNCNSSGSISISASSSKEEICTEADMWWRKVWKEHYQEQYKNSYKKFADDFQKNSKFTKMEDSCNINVKEINFLGNNKIDIANKVSQNNIFKSQQYYNSVAYCLKRLEKFDTFIPHCEKNHTNPQSDYKTPVPYKTNEKYKFLSSENSEEESDSSDDSHRNICKSGKKPYETLSDENKRDDTKTIFRTDKRASKIEHVKQAMSLMRFSFRAKSNKVPSGRVTYMKKNIRGQNRRLKFNYEKPRKHFFFDDDGNPVEYQHKNHIDASQSFEEIGDIYEDSKTLDGINTDPELISCEANSSSFDECKDSSDGCKKQKRKRKKLKKIGILPQDIVENKDLIKYWLRRYELFSKYDSGIQLDAESWFSVTPEKLARHHAERCRCDLIVDAFCGAGGNSIQFAFTCERVIAIDIDPQKIKMAKHNAKIYEVDDRIEFIVGDFTKLARGLRGDVVFLSPPWGGPEYKCREIYDLDGILSPLGGEGLFHLASDITDDVAIFLPKNTNSNDLALLSGPNGEVEIEQNFVDRRLRSVTAYFGGLIMDSEDA